MLATWLLAAFPVLVLVLLTVGLGWPASRAGPAGWLAAAVVAVAGFEAGPAVLAVAQGKAFFLALDVLLIVWAAYLLYRVVDAAGGVATLAAALPRLAPERGMQALLIAWSFASFLQGVGGFGVPVVVTAPILVGLGFDPVTAVVAPSLGHAWSVTFGSLGSSFQALMASSGFPGPAMARQSAALLGAACVVTGWIVLRLVRGGRRWIAPALVMGVVMAAAQFALAAAGLWQIAGFGGGLAGLATGVVAARLARTRSAAPTSPVPLRDIALALAGYALLVLVTLAVQFVEPVRDALGAVVVGATFPEVSTGLGVTTPAGAGKELVLLRHAGAILAYTSLLTLLILRRFRALPAGAAPRIVSATARGVLGSSLAILSMTAMVSTMSHAGMTDVLARGLAQVSGRAFPLIAPWIGALGAFVSGSNTSSNLLFGMLQARTAQVLGLSLAWILAAQTAGGALGSVLSPTKVSVGAASASAGAQEGRILRGVLRYAAPLLLGLGLLAWIGAGG